MVDVLPVAGALLVLGPVLGVLGFFDIGLWRVWTVPREEHLSMVLAHRRGWAGVNVGFVVATILTSAGLVVLAASSGTTTASKVGLIGAAMAYVIGGVLWCVVLGTRSRTTPTLAAMVASGTATEPGESLLGAALSGLFGAFSLATAVALVALGSSLALDGIVAAPIAWLVAISGLLCVAWYIRAGDLIPAVLYLPTLVLGIALLLGGAS